MPELSRPVARTTGLLYLALAVTGMVGFLLIRPMVFDPGDPGATAGHLVEDALLAGLVVTLELALVIAQALAAWWFFRLFRGVDTVAAATLAAFGTVNAVAILGSAAALGTAIDVAGTGDVAGVLLTTALADNFWAVGAVFFGLWLIPMGHLVLRAGLPRVLGWVLVVGGVGYVLDAFVSFLAPDAGLVAEALTFPATIGEFWMIGLLLWIGFRPGRSGVGSREESALHS